MPKIPPGHDFSHERLRWYIEMECKDGQGHLIFPKSIGSGRMHPNPRFYKYYWWVFTAQSKLEGAAFLSKENRIPYAEYIKIREKIAYEKGVAIIRKEWHPRRGPGTPFNPQAEKWKDAEWAPPFDEDPDEEYDGFK